MSDKRYTKSIAKRSCIRHLVNKYATEFKVTPDVAFCVIVKTKTYDKIMHDDLVSVHSDASLYTSLLYELNGNEEAWLRSLME